MAATNNYNNGQAGGDLVNGWTSSDWVLFPGSESNTSYQYGVDADSTTFENKFGPNDSGYFSNENFDAVDENIEDEDPIVWCQHNQYEHTYAAEAAASMIADHGSIYEGAVNESTSTIETANPKYSQEPKKTRTHRHKKHSSRSHPKSTSKTVTPDRLESWLEKEERHERIACGIEQSSKRRKTSAGRQ